MAAQDAQCAENSCTVCYDITDVVSHWEIVGKSDAQSWNLLNSCKASTEAGGRLVLQQDLSLTNEI